MRVLDSRRAGMTEVLDQPAAARDWRHSAACRNAADPEIFFPIVPGTADEVKALSYCDRCPVRFECLMFAVVHGEWGVWGGVWRPPPDSRYHAEQRRKLAA